MKKIETAVKIAHKDDDVFTVEVTRAELAVIHALMATTNKHDAKRALDQELPGVLNDSVKASNTVYEIYDESRKIVLSDA